MKRESPGRGWPRLPEPVLFAAVVVLGLLNIALVFPGMFVEPILLYRLHRTGASGLHQLVLLDLPHAAVFFVISRLFLTAFNMSDWAKALAISARNSAPAISKLIKTTPSGRPGVRVLALRITGQTIRALGAYLIIFGFQESLLNIGPGHTGLWLIGFVIAACGFPVSLFGVRTVAAANHAARFPVPESASVAVPVSRRVRSWVFRVASWLVRLLGGALVILGALLALYAVIFPAQRESVFYLGVFFDLVVVGLGRAVFTLGLTAKHASSRALGFAVPIVRPPTLPGWPRVRAGTLRVMGAIMLLSGTTGTLCGARLTLRDFTSPHSPSPSVHALIDVVVAVSGAAVFVLGSVARRVARRDPGLAAAVAPLPKRRSIHGWTLRAVSWVMRFVGSVAVFIGTLGSSMIGGISNSPGYLGPPGYVLVVVFVAVFFFGYATLKLGSIPAMLANRYLAKVLTSAADLSPGSYVLYLRPFLQDRTAGAQIPGYESKYPLYNPFIWMVQSNRSHEERLGDLFVEFGPLLAVGSPGEHVPGGAGALRIYLPLDGWKKIVAELIDNARLVVIGTGPSPGTVWEYVEVLRRRRLSRLVLLVTDPIEYERFKASSIAEAEGVLLELKSQYSDLWEAPILPDLPRYTTSKSDRSLWFRAMIYFTEDQEPHMISLTRSTVFGNFRVDNDRIRDLIYPMIAYLRGASTSEPARR